MTTLSDIENLTAAYAQARAELADRVGVLEAEIDRLTRLELPGIRQALAQASDRQAALFDAVEGAPELFEKPRTHTYSGVRVGFRQGKPRVVIPDEADTLARIRKQLPAEQAALLISVKEAVYKPGLADLTAADLKRLRITVEAGADEVLIKPTDSALDKLVASLLRDAEKRTMEQENAA